MYVAGDGYLLRDVIQIRAFRWHDLNIIALGSPAAALETVCLLPWSAVPSRDLVAAFVAKLLEEIDRIGHLAAMVAPEMLDSTPLPGFSFRVLLNHLLECTAGFCAALDRTLPGGLYQASLLKATLARPVDNATDALERLAAFSAALRTGFAVLEDTDLARRLPTVFVPEGEPLLTILLSNYSHLVAHKYQLFMYLKVSGVAVGTPDLYLFRDVE